MQEILDALLAFFWSMMGDTLTDMAIQIFGLVGTLCVALPFVLGSSMGRADWHPTTWKFILVNFTGAVILLISLMWHPNLGSIVIELFWISGGLIAIRKKLNS
ncbi:hypothetical protein GR7B_00192 [Vibrio phage vB_VcorM_GR7B]|nr:hypothetical protein GR7B_00192 [Vibrio phage vB_VcorM_GR7B]